MIRRRPKHLRRISARDRTTLDAYYRKCGVPKTFRATAQRTRKLTRRQAITQTRKQVWRRSSVCEFCGDSEQRTWERLRAMGSARPGVHQLHEVFISRAKGRGLPPDELFTLRNCARVCVFCHDAHHAGEIRVQETTEGAGCQVALLVTAASEGPPAALPAWARQVLYGPG
jgi:hypothetical protein